jgi:hypothetical protein
MIEPEQSPNVDVEALVRRSLERDAESIDPRVLFMRIQESLPGAWHEAGRAAPPRGAVLRAWKWAGVAAAAATVVICLAFFSQGRTALAKGETVVRDARQAHSLPIDRCYLVEIRRESPLADELTPVMPQVRLTRLWTRGDRFWVESVRPEQRWAWGRDEVNRFWIAFGPHNALSLDADEVPPWLNLYCDLHSLNFEHWLGEVLDRFDLSRDAPAEGPQRSTIQVHAKARYASGDHPSIQTADLEIDAETRVVRRMVVNRVWKKQPFATVTYTLAESDARDPADYRLEGHLSDPSQVFTREHDPERRKELLSRWFGPRSTQWFRTLEPLR